MEVSEVSLIFVDDLTRLGVSSQFTREPPCQEPFPAMVCDPGTGA